MIDSYITDALTPDGPKLLVQPGPDRGPQVVRLSIESQQLTLTTTVCAAELVRALRIAGALPGESATRSAAVARATAAVEALAKLGCTADDLGQDVLALARYIADGTSSIPTELESAAVDTTLLGMSEPSRETAGDGDEPETSAAVCDRCGRPSTGGIVGGGIPSYSWCDYHRPDDE